MILDSPPEWKKVQGAAIKTVRSRFDISNYMEKLDKIYRSAAE